MSNQFEEQAPWALKLQQQFVRRVHRNVPAVVLERFPALSDLEPAQIREAKPLREFGYPVRVTRIRQEANDVATIRFRALDGYRLHYRAGQHVRIAVVIGHCLLRRYYSLTSSPEEPDMAITVKAIEHGCVSQFLVKHLKVGDQFAIADPMGDFVLPQPLLDKQRFLFIAAEIGIAPTFALIKDLLRKNPAADVQLIYLKPAAETFIYRQSLQHMAKFYKGLQVQYIEAGQRYRACQRVRERLLDVQRLLPQWDADNTHVYISAPPELTVDLRVLFQQTELKTPLRLELFNRMPALMDDIEFQPQVISFYRSRWLGGFRQATQAKVETLLSTARKNRIKLTPGCKVKLKKGLVVMEEPNGLSLAEMRAGEIMPCMAYPCEPLIVRLS